MCLLPFTLLRIDEILDELARETSPDQAPDLPLLNLQSSSPASQGTIHLDDQSVQQVMPCLTLYLAKLPNRLTPSFFSFPQKNITKPTTSYSFSIEDYIIEKGEEITSHQTLSLENQARLKEVIILLNKDTISLVQDADQIKDLLELIDQDIPSALKAPLESAAHLDDHFAMVRRATKNISSRTALQKDRSLKKLEIKDLHSHIHIREIPWQLWSPN